MDRVEFEETGAPRSKIWRRAFFIAIPLVAIVILIAWLACGWASRMALLHTMLGEGSYSLENNPATISRVKAVLPRLIEIHREAVAECGESTMADLSRMDAFNRRTKSWHAILMDTVPGSVES